MAQLQNTSITGSFSVPSGVIAGNAATSSILSFAGATSYGGVNSVVSPTDSSLRLVALQGNVYATGSIGNRAYGGYFTIEVPESNVSPINELRGSYSYVISRGSAPVTTQMGGYFLVQNYTSSVTTMRGMASSMEHYGSTTVSNAIGQHSLINNYGSGTFTIAQSGDFFTGNREGGIITNAIGVGIQIRNYKGGTITNAYGLSIGDTINNPWGNLGAGTVTNSYAIYISNTVDMGASTRYAIYSESTSNSYLQGNLGVGTSTPTTFKVETSGSIGPSVDAAFDLGSSSRRWNVVYTTDLNLNNGIGDWTIVEGEDDLFIYNNKKDKVYKFNLIEVDPSIAPAKRH